MLGTTLISAKILNLNLANNTGTLGTRSRNLRSHVPIRVHIQLSMPDSGEELTWYYTTDLLPAWQSKAFTSKLDLTGDWQ